VIIKDGLLIVVTGSNLYEEEKAGRKPYTLRLTTKREYDQLFNEKPDFIRIYRGGVDTTKYFTRTIVAMHDLDRILGKHLVGITFDPTQEV
jgi:hypothetical protein